MRRLIYLLPLAVFAAIAIYFALPILQKKDPKILPSALIDKPAPARTLPPLVDGKPGVDPALLSKGVKLVNFFASWCVPCRAEHPLFMGLAAKGEVPLIGISYRDKKDAALAWLAELGDPYQAIGVDGDGRVGIDWGVYGVPETYVVDGRGTIRYRHVGPVSKSDLEEILLPMVRRLRGEGS